MVKPSRELQWGIPRRMALALFQAFAADSFDYSKHERKVQVIYDLLTDDLRIPLATTDGRTTGEPAIWNAAEIAARECYEICGRVQTADAILIAIGMQCRRRGVPLPVGATVPEIIARAIDKAWWRRAMRTEWRRRFEHTAIQLGLTGAKVDPYISRESAVYTEALNRANREMLENRKATNEHGQEYTLAELADKGMGNKSLRRGELMLRIRGFEECADAMRAMGMFWTITCPSKFHSVGGTNPRYQGATPRDAQAYLCKVWARIRAALHRKGIRPFGFRIAEPHTDGCPHWHMLLFVDRKHAAMMEAVVREHALAEDGHETGAQDNRVKLVQIEAGKGTAAGYIAKYVSKNIDGTGVGDHKAFEDGRTYVVAPDLFGDLEITPSARVTYWSQVWGIRQFQQIGGPPVGVWREMRRVRAEAVQNAPEAVRAAHAACQKIESTDPAVAKQADYAAFIQAMGGPTVGRRGEISIAARVECIKGKYGLREAKKPVGVYLSAQPQAVYESVRYRWTVEGLDRTAKVAVPRPWTGVNNCTEPPFWTRKEMQPEVVSDDRIRAAKREARAIMAPDLYGPIRMDQDTIERYRRHARRFEKSHLEYLKAKYDDRH